MKKPTIHPSTFVGEGAVIRGDVVIGRECSIWFNATIRAEESPIRIGDYTNVQDNAVVHIDTNYPTTIGCYVSIGHGAIVHGCTVGNNTLVGMGATILNGAIIGDNCIIGANALIPQHMHIPSNSMVLGVPGKIIRNLTQEEVASITHNAHYYIKEGRTYGKEEKERH